MPIFDDSQQQYPPKEDVPPVAKPPAMSTVAEDTRYESNQNLLTWVEGRAWTLKAYYSQVLARGDQLSAQQITLSADRQQYREIIGMELKVTEPLSKSQDAEQKSMVLQGSANTYPCLVANEGDMFVADAGDGRLVVFQVTSSERKSVLKESIYSITYESADYYTDARIDDFRRKTIETYYFVRDFLNYGQNPMLLKEEFESLKAVSRFYGSSLEEYMLRYLSREFLCLTIPGQSLPTYDHFMAQMIDKTVGVRDSYILSKMKILNCDCSLRMQQPSVLDALMERNRNKLDYCFQQVGMASYASFTRVPYLDGVYYSGIRYLVFPTTSVEQGWDTNRDHGELIDYQLASTGDFHSGSIVVPDSTNPNQTRTMAIIKPVLTDTYYIFSKAFYENDRVNMSGLENLVMDYLELKEPSLLRLALIIQDSKSWGRMEKFYYLPILYVMIKYYIRSI